MGGRQPGGRRKSSGRTTRAPRYCPAGRAGGDLDGDGRLDLTTSNQGVDGETSTQIKTRFVAATSPNYTIATIWAGTNNYTDGATVLSDIAAMVARQKNDHYIVLPLRQTGNDSTFWIGGSEYNKVAAINASLLSSYPNNYCDVNSAILAAYDHNQAQDVIDVGHGIYPNSLRYDPLGGHLNEAGRNVVADTVANFIRGKGWV